MIAALEKVTGSRPAIVWHADTDMPQADLIVLPGGFSYGDYLRSGAIAARAPVMRAVAERAAAGVPVLGICNGFQILCEAGLLPGVLMRNASLRFICREVHLRVETANTLFTNRYAKGQVLRCPVAHGDGNYRCDDGHLKRLTGEDRVAFRYVDAAGEPHRRFQSQRLDRRYRRHPQRPPQRARHDAAPGRPDRGPAGRHRRPRPVREHRRRTGERRMTTRISLLAGLALATLTALSGCQTGGGGGGRRRRRLRTKPTACRSGSPTPSAAAGSRRARPPLPATSTRRSAMPPCRAS